MKTPFSTTFFILLVWAMSAYGQENTATIEKEKKVYAKQVYELAIARNDTVVKLC